MEQSKAGPSEEVLKALDEFVDINFDETRRTRKRSSILKQPRSSDDDQADKENRKSFSKRRVTFSSKFQVMELCTGNVYDISGKSVSTSDATSSGDLSAASKTGVNNNSTIHLSRNETQVQLSTDSSQPATKDNLLPFSKKHGIISDEDIEPERKRINNAESVSTLFDAKESNFFSFEDNSISNFKKYLFGDDCTDKEYHSTNLISVENTQMETPLECLKQLDNDFKAEHSGLNDSGILNVLKTVQNNVSSTDIQGKHGTNFISKTVVKEYNSKGSNMSSLKDKSNFDFGSQCIYDSVFKHPSNVEVLPIQVTDLSFEKNKENIYVDVKNRSILMTNTTDLRLKERKSLQVLKPEIQKNQVLTFSEKSLDFENHSLITVENQAVSSKKRKQSLLNKTLITSCPMEITCMSPEVCNNESRQSIDDMVDKDNLICKENLSDGNKVDETQLDKSCYMKLTCNMEDTSDDSLNKLLTVDKDDILVTQKHFSDDLNKTTLDKSHFMDLTCNFKNINTYSNEFDKCTVDDTGDKIDLSAPQKLLTSEINKTCVDKSYFMDLTCYAGNLNNSLTNQFKQSVDCNKDENVESSNITHLDKSHLMEITCCAENVSDISVDNSLHLSNKENIVDRDNILPSKEHACYQFDKTQLYKSHHMEITCNVGNLNSSFTNELEKSTDREDAVDKDDTLKLEQPFSSMLNTTQLDVSHMELTCNMKNLTDTLPCSINSDYSMEKLHESKPSVESNKKDLTESNDETDAIGNTCSVYNAFDNLPISAENSYSNKQDPPNQPVEICISNDLKEPNTKLLVSLEPKLLSSTEPELVNEDDSEFSVTVYNKSPQHLVSQSGLGKVCSDNKQSSYVCTDEKVAESDKKVGDISKLSEFDIVYAIKRVKDINSASTNDYNIFKFPEVYLSLKKHVRPRTSFSCSKIHITKAIRESIRRSSSFCYASGDIISKLREKYVSSESEDNKLVKSDENLNKKNSVAFSHRICPPTPNSPKTPSRSVTLSKIICNSETTKLTSSCKAVRKSLLIEYCQSPKQSTSVNKSNLIQRKDSFSILDKSPDTINCLRSSFNSRNETTCNLPNVSVSQINGEDIEDTFPDGSKFDLANCSLTLVSNDDTFDNAPLKQNSTTFKELSSTNCFTQYCEQSLNNIALLKNDAKSVESYKSLHNVLNNTPQKNSVLMMQKCVSEEFKASKSSTLDDFESDSVFIPQLQQHFMPTDRNDQENALKDQNQKLVPELMEIEENCKIGEEKKSYSVGVSQKSFLFTSKSDIKAQNNTCIKQQNEQQLKKYVSEEINKTNSFSKHPEQTMKGECTIKPTIFEKGVNEVLLGNESLKSLQSLTKSTKETETAVETEEVETIFKETYTSEPNKFDNVTNCCNEFQKHKLCEHTGNVLENTNVNRAPDMKDNDQVDKDMLILNSLEMVHNKFQNAHQESVVERQIEFTSQHDTSSEVISLKVVAQYTEVSTSSLAPYNNDGDELPCVAQNEMQISQIPKNNSAPTNDCNKLPSIAENEVQNSQILKNSSAPTDDGNKLPSIAQNEMQNSQILRNSPPVINEKRKNKSLFLEDQEISQTEFPQNLIEKSKENQISNLEKDCQISTSKDEDLASVMKSEVRNNERSLKKCTSKLLPEENMLSKTSANEDIFVEDCNISKDCGMQNDDYLKDYYELIHSYRRKFKQASENEACLWCLKEMNDKLAVFNILPDSIYASYLMYADMRFDSKSASCSKISFEHKNKDADERDELGFLLFKTLVSEDEENFPFPADGLIDKLPKYVEFALRAKALVKDVWITAIDKEISIDMSDDIPRLNVEVFNGNEDYFSLFCLTFPINLKTYPNEKIIPDIKHLEYYPIDSEIILNAVKDIHPTEYYLSKMAEAAAKVELYKDTL